MSRAFDLVWGTNLQHFLYRSVGLGSSVLAVIVAMQAARYRQWPIWRHLSLTMIAVAIWCFGDGMLFLSDDVQTRRFWFAHLDRWLTRAVEWHSGCRCSTAMPP